MAPAGRPPRNQGSSDPIAGRSHDVPCRASPIACGHDLDGRGRTRKGDIQMAHTGTSVGLAKQPATGFGAILLTAMIVLAIGVGVVAVTLFIATPNRGVGVPTADHSYDQVEHLRGAAVFSAAGDHSYDQIETQRAGTVSFSLPQSAVPASARDYRSASKPEI